MSAATISTVAGMSGISLHDPNFDALTYDPAAFKDPCLSFPIWPSSNRPDLTAFYNRGGKLILRQNLADKGQSAPCRPELLGRGRR